MTNEYHERCKRNQAELRAQVGEIAAELNKLTPYTWQIEPLPDDEYLNDRWTGLVTAQGYGLTFERDRGRLHIGGDYPRYDNRYLVSHHDNPPRGRHCPRHYPPIYARLRGTVRQD